MQSAFSGQLLEELAWRREMPHCLTLEEEQAAVLDFMPLI